MALPSATCDGCETCLLLGSCAVTAISPPREMFEQLSPTPMLFYNKKKGSNYQIEPLECHSTKALQGLELLDLSHNFVSLYLSGSTCRAEGEKNFILQDEKSSGSSEALLKGHRDPGHGTGWREEREGNLLRPGDCTGRQGLLMNMSRMCLNFSFVWTQGKVPPGNLQPLLLRSNEDEIHDQ